jgi:hypothetical protein
MATGGACDRFNAPTSIAVRFRSCGITADRRRFNTKMTARDFNAATKD